jgi:hypothetical protein
MTIGASNWPDVGGLDQVVFRSQQKSPESTVLIYKYSNILFCFVMVCHAVKVVDICKYEEECQECFGLRTHESSQRG